MAVSAKHFLIKDVYRSFAKNELAGFLCFDYKFVIENFYVILPAGAEVDEGIGVGHGCRSGGDHVQSGWE